LEYVFDPTLPNKIIAFGEKYCRLSKHPFNGQPIKLLPYQRQFITDLYGWRKPDGELKHSLGQIWIGKKNGKSSFSAYLSLWNLLSTPGSEVYVISETVEAADQVFDEACNMVEQDPVLRKRLWVRRNRKCIEDETKFSKLKVRSCSPEINAINCGCMILDELAAWPKCHAQIVWDRIQGAGKARKDHHKIVLSTAQFDKTTVGYHQYWLAKQTLKGEIDRADILPVIFEVDEHENWRDPTNWRKANPAADVLWPFSRLEDDYKKIESSPIDEAGFRTLALNQWVGHADQWIASDVWAKCHSPIDETALHGRPAYVGIDYARRYDLASYCIIVPVDDLVYLLPRFFIPEKMAEKKQRIDRVPYLLLWKDDPRCHLFLTEGDVVDPGFMRAKLAEDAKNFDIQEIGFDPYGMEETRQILEAEGYSMVEITQSPAVMSPAVAHFERLVIQQKIVHDNPILSWNLGNCKIRQIGASDQIMLDKQKSTARIDGVTASCIAITRLLSQQEFYSAPILWG
jgi:phage terminase large subunit-like protein